MDAAEKTLSVLDALGTGQAEGGSRLGAIADRAGLPKPTVHRLLKRLVERGYAQAQGDGNYVLGPRILAMAGDMLDHLDAGPAARALLRALHDEVGHTVHFAMRTGDEATYVEKLVDPSLPYQTASRVGGRIPLYCTAIGKALLAAMPAEEADALLGRADWTPRTPNTLAGPDAMRAELAVVRDQGFAIDDEENERNIRCVGSVVRDSRGRPLGAVSLSALTVELSYDDAVRLGPRLAATAQRLSAAYGAIEPAA